MHLSGTKLKCTPHLCYIKVTNNELVDRLIIFLYVNIKEEVKSLITNTKLEVLFKHDGVIQFENPTIEFITSFSAFKGGWKFRLGGKNFKSGRKQICELFDFF